MDVDRGDSRARLDRWEAMLKQSANRIRQTWKTPPGTFFLKHEVTGRARAVDKPWPFGKARKINTTEVCPHGYLLIPFCKEASTNFLSSSVSIFLVLYYILTPSGFAKITLPLSFL